MRITAPPLRAAIHASARGRRRCARSDAGVAERSSRSPGLRRGDASTLENTPRAIPVEVTPVVEQSLTPPVTATGTLGGKEEVALSFTIGGVISRILVDEGSASVRGNSSPNSCRWRSVPR